MIRFASPGDVLAALDALPTCDQHAISTALARQQRLTKPTGALGRLEDIAVFMAGWQARALPGAEIVQAVVFAGNHGVTAQGVSAYPAAVTAQMVANFAAGGAAINALAGTAGATLSVVALDLDRPTGDITREPAMSVDECLDAMNRGAAAVDPQDHLFLAGEMGIGNTTPAAALCAQALGGTGADWVGRGTGLDDVGIARKAAAVDAALALHGTACTDPVETLRHLGGREIAAMAGAMLAARLARVPVLLDGFIACAAILPLWRASPAFTDHCLAAHCSAEAGHARLLDALGLEPLLRLGLRLGEGTGAALAVPIVRAALAAHAGMATFEEAAVDDRR